MDDFALILTTKAGSGFDSNIGALPATGVAPAIIKKKQREDGKMKKVSKDQVLFKEMKEAFRKCGLPISMENYKGRLNFSTGVVQFEDIFDYSIVVSYATDIGYIHIVSTLAPLRIPKKKVQDLLTIINAVNDSHSGVTATFSRKLKILELRTGMYALKSRFNREEFKARINHLMEVGILSYPVLMEFIVGNIDTERALRLIC